MCRDDWGSANKPTKELAAIRHDITAFRNEIDLVCILSIQATVRWLKEENNI